MKKLIALIITAAAVCPLLFSCTGSGAETSYEPYTQVITAPETDTDTEAVTDTAAETVEETTEAPTTAPEPEPSPYGIFTYTENKINVNVSSPYAILIDANTKEILYLNCDPTERIYPASTTKLLTSLVALKHCDPSVVFKPGDELTLVEKDSSIAYIKTHHELTCEMLIEGMMLPSGGDAAYALAAGVGKIIANDPEMNGIDAVKVFMDEMNRYAVEELGLTGSHFTTPDGYDDPEHNHYTTLIDIMTVGYAAMNEPIIMKYAGTAEDNVRYASGHKMTWVNGNKLIVPDSKYFYENATGIKTGTTDDAGCCLISSAALGVKRMLAGVFKTSGDKMRYTDSRNLLACGLDR